MDQGSLQKTKFKVGQKPTVTPKSFEELFKLFKDRFEKSEEIAKAKERLHNISMAECRPDAEQAFAFFLSTYEAKYPKATECLAKDRGTLLTFFDFPAEHWLHIRTTNPIESTFATVRLRTSKTRGCVSRASMLAMAFKLTKTAEQKWRTLKGHALLPAVVQGVKFKDGLQEGESRIAA